MTGPWGEGEPGSPGGLQPPAPGTEPGDRLPGPYGGPPHDGGVPDGEPGRPARLPDGEPGVPERGEPPREQRDRVGGPGGGRPGPWRAPDRRRDGDDPDSAADAPRDAPPEDVRTARVLWLVATGFALVGALLNALTSRLSDLPPATRGAVTDTAARSGEAVQVDALFRVAMGLGAVLAVVAAAVTVWLVTRLLAGRGWARTLLDIVGIFLVVDGVAVVIGVFSGTLEPGSRGEALTFVVVSLQILAALCAGTAVWRQHTAEATAFLSGSRRGRA